MIRFFFSPQEITTSIKLEHFPPQKFSSGNGSNSRPNKKNISNDFVFAEMSFLFFFPASIYSGSFSFRVCASWALIGL